MAFKVRTLDEITKGLNGDREEAPGLCLGVLYVERQRRRWGASQEDQEGAGPRQEATRGSVLSSPTLPAAANRLTVLSL